MNVLKPVPWPLLVAVVAALACNLPAGVSAPTSFPAQGLTETAPIPSPTSLLAQPTQASTDPTPKPEETGTEEPLCTVLTELNFRPGPGTAYRPPIRALPAGTTLIPTGFNPTGVPGGPWVQVSEPARNQIGWVSAGQQFVSCNIDLGTLPSVAVAPPAPPPFPQVTDSAPEGDTGGMIGEPLFFREGLVQMRIYDPDSGSTDNGAGIDNVRFEIIREDDPGTVIYERVEREPAYCIFGGGEPDCNPWVLEDFAYKWAPGGEVVRPGDYRLNIFVTALDGDEGSWRMPIEISLPES